VRPHVVGEIRCRPARQRIDADALANRLEHVQLRPCSGLETLASGEPGRIRRKPTRHRLDLADVAASIRVALMQCTVGIAFGQRSRVGVKDLKVAQAEIGDQRVAIIERLAKMLAGIEE
jgi:hypothetical protein